MSAVSSVFHNVRTSHRCNSPTSLHPGRRGVLPNRPALAYMAAAGKRVPPHTETRPTSQGEPAKSGSQVSPLGAGRFSGPCAAGQLPHRSGGGHRQGPRCAGRPGSPPPPPFPPASITSRRQRWRQAPRRSLLSRIREAREQTLPQLLRSHPYTPQSIFTSPPLASPQLPGRAGDGAERDAPFSRIRDPRRRA